MESVWTRACARAGRDVRTDDAYGAVRTTLTAAARSAWLPARPLSMAGVDLVGSRRRASSYRPMSYTSQAAAGCGGQIGDAGQERIATTSGKALCFPSAPGPGEVALKEA